MTPTIQEQDIKQAAAQGYEAFLRLITNAILTSVGGQLNADNMTELNGEQITLIAWRMMHDEVMQGGFIQLIHNGLGPFIFLNPFAKAMRLWGQDNNDGDAVLHDFSRLIYKGRKLFEQYADALTQPCSDDEFMALYEQYPEFDELDDTFIDTEEDITAAIAHYIDNHLPLFCNVVG